jgi:sec-independent protein translocase protein TatB
VFNLSGSEVIIILILALLILGPDKLPEAMRRAGRTWGELRKLSSGFQEEVRKGFEEPANEVKQTAAAVRKAAAFPSKKLTYNPLKDPPPVLPDGESVAEPDPADAEPTTGSGATAAGGDGASGDPPADVEPTNGSGATAAGGDGASGDPPAATTTDGSAGTPAPDTAS